MHMEVSSAVTNDLLDRATKIFQATIWDLARQHWPSFFKSAIEDGPHLVRMTGGELGDLVRTYLRDEDLRVVCADNRRRSRLREDLLLGKFGVWNARNFLQHSNMHVMRKVKATEFHLRNLQEAVFLLGETDRAQDIRALRDELKAEAQKTWEKFLAIDRLIATAGTTEIGEEEMDFLLNYDETLAEARKADLGPITPAGRSECLRRIARSYVTLPVIGDHGEYVRTDYNYW
ncbi:hypothetical protein V8F20_006902 [Naviculisporaceae sp. PSN 640]